MKSLLYHSHAELKRVTKQVVTGYNKASMKLRAWDEQTFFYALRTLHTHLRSMKKEIPGVRKSNDIESVHKMRVACRRFLTTLEVFADLFPAKSVKSWRKSNRRILRTLRQERDAGIQMDFLLHLPTGLRNSKERPGIARPILRLKQKREKEQDRIIDVLREWKKERGNTTVTCGLSLYCFPA